MFLKLKILNFSNTALIHCLQLGKRKEKKLNFKSTLRLYGQLFVVKQLLFYHYLLIILFWEGGVGWVEWGWRVANENIHDTQTGEKQEQEF